MKQLAMPPPVLRHPIQRHLKAFHIRGRVGPLHIPDLVSKDTLPIHYLHPSLQHPGVGIGTPAVEGVVPHPLGVFVPDVKEVMGMLVVVVPAGDKQPPLRVSFKQLVQVRGQLVRHGHEAFT